MEEKYSSLINMFKNISEKYFRKINLFLPYLKKNKCIICIKIFEIKRIEKEVTKLQLYMKRHYMWKVKHDVTNKSRK